MYQGLTSDERCHLRITKELQKRHGGSLAKFLANKKMQRDLKREIVMAAHPLLPKEVSDLKWANNVKNVDDVDDVDDEFY